MTRRTTAAPRAALLALALAATSAVGGLPAAAGSPVAVPALERVVVTGPDAADSVRRAGGRVLDPLPLVDGVGALLPHGARLPAGVRVVADRPLSLQQAESTATGSPSTVRATLGLPASGDEGRDVLVAVVDTGVEEVPALAGRVTHVTLRGTPEEDGLGHGTFIAGLVAGRGAVPGVAPAAHVLDVKVADDDGTTGLVDVLRGLQAASAAGADVVNLALSSGSPLPAALDPLAVALDRLWRDGVTVVVPSGNDPAVVSSPGDAPWLLTTGALAEAGTADRADDTVAPFSGRGRGKPDLVAPGASLVSLMAPGSAAQGAQHRTDLPAGYGAGSGTSFATAVTAGAAAALLGERPSLTPDQVKDLLTGTAYGSRALRKAAGGGAGGLDLRAALAAKTPKPAKADSVDDVPAQDLEAWTRFVEAMITGDAAAAASSWSELSPQARHWSARQWSAVDQETREAEGEEWSARQWSVDGWTEAEWLARHWSARQWSARQWSNGDWSARQWSASSWSARHWAAEWSARQWSARQWSARQWSARQWSARQWSARQWSAADWS